MRENSPSDPSTLRPLSARDSGRFLMSAQSPPDAELREHAASLAQLHGTEFAAICATLPSPWDVLSMRCLASSPAMSPERLLEFTKIIANMVESGSLSRDREDFGEVFHRLSRYAVNIYTRQDDPHLTASLRELLSRAEELMFQALQICSAKLGQGGRFTASLTALAERMETVLRQMASAGILKKSRDATVLHWCRANVFQTRQHYVDPDSGLAALPRVVEEALADIKVMAVIFNILLDEIADDLQDYKKFSAFRKIPFAESGALDVVSESRRSALSLTMPRVWQEYFNLAVDTWNSIVEALQELVGGAMFKTFEKQLRRDYQEILGAMDYALAVNSQPTVELLSRVGGGEILAYNMNMMAFETFDRMALGRYSPAVSGRLEPGSSAYDLLRHAVAMFQYNGQIGNSTATLEAEIGENCIANIAILHAFKGRESELADIFYRRRDALGRGDIRRYQELGELMSQNVAQSNIRAFCLREWETHRAAAIRLLNEANLTAVIDVDSTVRAHDMLLSLSWMFRGDI